jgi:hypothetical protein
VTNKYGARKSIFAGEWFDSTAERNYYMYLLALKQSGEVAQIERQPQYVLQEAFRNAAGKHRASIKYTADFRVTYTDGRVEVIDVKGVASRDYSLRKRMFEKRYGIAIVEVKTKDVPRAR